MTPTYIIHLAQCPIATMKKAAAIALEVFLVPAAILASLGGAGHLTLAIMAVFLWRLIVGAGRLAFVGFLPFTSILTFMFLTAKTGAGGALSLTGSPSALAAYILPGCIVGALTGLYFVATSRSSKPVAMRLATDFVNLSDDSRDKLLPLFRALTAVIGVLNFLFSVATAVTVFTATEEQASLLAGILAAAGPVTIGFSCMTIGVYLLRRQGLWFTFKAPVVQTA